MSLLPTKKSDERTTRLILGTIGLGLIVWLVLQFRASSVTHHSNSQANSQAVLNGQNIYQNQCAGCHEATNLPLATPPPKLVGLFQQKTLPNGAPATDEEVRDVILKGRGIMPPFSQVLSSDDVNALIQYLHTR